MKFAVKDNSIYVAVATLTFHPLRHCRRMADAEVMRSYFEKLDEVRAIQEEELRKGAGLHEEVLDYCDKAATDPFDNTQILGLFKSHGEQYPYYG